MLTVALVLYPNFSPFHFSTPYMVFSSQINGRSLFNLNIISMQVEQQSEHPVWVKPDGGSELLERADIIIIPGWHDLTAKPCADLIYALQSANQRGALIVGLCYGTYALAYSGILNGKSAATHWLGEKDFKQRFPQIKLDLNALYVEQDNIITSAGVVASLDCCLTIVRKYYGVKIANTLARLFVTAPHREGGQAQFIEQPIARKTPDQSINQLLDFLRENLTLPHKIDQLADKLAISRSSFTRHFRKATGMSLTKWLIETKLQIGCDLLESTQLSIESIAEQVGFNSSTSFREHFKAKYQISPTRWRANFAEIR